MTRIFRLSRPTLRLALSALLSALALALVLPFVRADSLTRQLPDPTIIESTAKYSCLGSEMSSCVETERRVTGSNAITRTLLFDPATRVKIHPTLLKRLLTAEPDDRIPIVIEMREQVDLDEAAIKPDDAERAETIVAALQATAARSQVGLRTFLALREIAGRAGHVRPFWIFNGVAAHVAAEDIATLATRDDVGLIREDSYRQWITDYPTAQPPADLSASVPSTPTSVEWGIGKIRADEVWVALDITGTGVVVANMDTGVDWQHPALQASYRGYSKGLQNHVGNWFDATGEGTVYPIDPHSHGTHTMGTMVGSDGIGVAPGARWIAIRVLNAAGFGYDSWIHAGFEWTLAPNGDPALAPDVLNNSWGNDISTLTTFQNDLRALRGAGIFVVFSAGNAGPGAGSVGSPASLPEAFAAGATDDEDDVASFSSRGPSPWGEIRPHVVAPGVNVRSSIPGGGYAQSYGTSIAAPHVAGTAALMLSADPSLTITDTAFALTSTAIPLSTTIPNNDSGYGRIDAYAAVQSVASAGTLSGTVVRSDTAAPIAGATIIAQSGGNISAASTDTNGRYTRGLVAGVYTVTASAFGFMPSAPAPVLMITGTTTVLDFALEPLPAGELRGSLTDAESGQPISGTIVVVGTPITASANNAYSATLPGGTYELRATASAHRVLTASVAITPGQVVTRDFALPPAPSILLIDSGPWYYGSQIGYYRAALDDLRYAYDEHRVKNIPADVPISATLSPYDVVVWSAPLDAPGLIGAGDAISQYLASGGTLFLSGQDVGYYDGGLTGVTWSDYYHDRLKANAIEDDAGARALTGTGVFAGIDVSIQGPGGADNQSYPDAIASADPDFTADAFYFDNGKLGGQLTGLCLSYRAAYLSFGFEAITSTTVRREVMSRTLSYFATPRNEVGMTLAASDDLLIGSAGSTVTTTIRLRNIAELGGSDTFTLTTESGGWSVSLSDSLVTLDSCNAGAVTATVSIPPGAAIDAKQSITVTARSAISPELTVSDSFVAKAPALVLLVDDDRWYDIEAAYQTALTSNGISFDRWDVNKSFIGPEPATPSPERLDWYPFVIWFTGYDWYQPLTANNEATLTQYLDGGGRVLISSQSHLGWSDVSDFSRTRLGALDVGYVTTTLARSLPGSPFDGIGTLALSYPFPNWSENAAPYPTATVALVGSHGRPIALTREEGAGKAMFLSFPFEAIPESARPVMMERAVGYLSWLGGSSVTADKTVAAPGSDIGVEIVARNDGPSTLSSIAFTATLPPSVSLQSGNTMWSGSLTSGQAVSVTFDASLDGGIAPGGVVSIPVAFTDADHAITFHKEVHVGVGRPDLSASEVRVAANPARPHEVVTWTIVARNTGLADAPSTTVTGLLPIDTLMMSGTLTSSQGTASKVTTGTVQWSGAISAGASITLTYQMSVPRTVTDGLHFGSALFDDGAVLNQSKVWLAAQPYRFYLPVAHK